MQHPSHDPTFAAGGVPSPSKHAEPRQQRSLAGCYIGGSKSNGATTPVAGGERAPGHQQQQHQQLLPLQQCPICGRLFLNQAEADAHMQSHAAAAAAATVAAGVPGELQMALPEVYPLHRPAPAGCSSSSSVDGCCHCPVCCKAFDTASNLRRHMLVHTGKRLHTCQVCAKQFSGSSNLKAHMVVHTGERRFRCPECGKAFATSSNLKTHSVVHTGRRPFQCELCLREFSVSSNLKSHMFVHTGERRHECQVCGKQFTSSSHVKVHMLTHSGEKPHQCDMCPKSFAVSSNLKAHRKIHLGQRDHVCDSCGKRFITSSDLKSHRASHTGERPHECPVCHERFGKRSNMKAHMLTHTGERPFQCQHCHRRFSKAFALRVHASKRHPQQQPKEPTIAVASKAVGPHLEDGFPMPCGLLTIAEDIHPIRTPGAKSSKSTTIQRAFAFKAKDAGSTAGDFRTVAPSVGFEDRGAMLAGEAVHCDDNSPLQLHVAVIKEEGWRNAADFEVSATSCNPSGRFKTGHLQQHPDNLSSHYAAAMASNCAIKIHAATATAAKTDGHSGTGGICNQLSFVSQAAQFTAETDGAESNSDVGQLRADVSLQGHVKGGPMCLKPRQFQDTRALVTHDPAPRTATCSSLEPTYTAPN